MVGLTGEYVQSMIPIGYLTEMFGIQWYMWVCKLGERNRGIIHIWTANDTRDRPVLPGRVHS